MFSKTETSSQLDLFMAPDDLLPKRARKQYDDAKSRHNQFFSLVTSRINEESFRPLFEDTNMGAPNASIRRLVAMNILKDGFRCSDEAQTIFLCQMYVDKCAETDDIPNHRMSKNFVFYCLWEHRRQLQTKICHLLKWTLI